MMTEAALEIRPDHKDRFDEIVARFADGGVHIETMSKRGVYIDFLWNDGKHCQLWITSKGKLRYNVEPYEGDPPRFTSWGEPNPLAAIAMETRQGQDGETRLGAKHDSAAIAQKDKL